MSNQLSNYSDVSIAQDNAFRYLGPNAVLYPSTDPKKKYMVYDPVNKKYVSFGAMGYQDYTKHKDEKRKANYLKRASKIKGDWKGNPYSANNLSIEILWS
jgi:hypothetical protein